VGAAVRRHCAPIVAVGDHCTTASGRAGNDSVVLLLRAVVAAEHRTRNRAVENCHSGQWRREVVVAAADSLRTNDAVTALVVVVLLRLGGAADDGGVGEVMVFFPDDDGENAADRRVVAAMQRLRGAGKE
jgi:hypothetical protein